MFIDISIRNTLYTTPNVKVIRLLTPQNTPLDAEQNIRRSCKPQIISCCVASCPTITHNIWFRLLKNTPIFIKNVKLNKNFVIVLLKHAKLLHKLEVLLKKILLNKKYAKCILQYLQYAQCPYGGSSRNISYSSDVFICCTYHAHVRNICLKIYNR